jgi:hypothetical protein
MCQCFPVLIAFIFTKCFSKIPLFYLHQTFDGNKKKGTEAQVWGSVAGCYEHSNKPLVSVKCNEFK